MRLTEFQIHPRIVTRQVRSAVSKSCRHRAKKSRIFACFIVEWMFPATYTRKALDFVFSMNELKVIPALPWIRDFREKTRVEKPEELGLLPVSRESLIQQKTYYRRERDTLLDPGYSR